MASVTKLEIFDALQQRGGFEVVTEKETPAQLRIVGRCQQDRWPFFSIIIFKLLEQSGTPKSSWTCDVSKQYMLHADQLRFGWRLIFQAKELAKSYASIQQTIATAPRPARVEVDRVLLPGYKEGDVRGGVNAKGKGSSSAGAMPLILTRGPR